MHHVMYLQCWQKLGKQTAFIGKVGDDMFGRQLTEAVSSVGVDTRALLVDKEVRYYTGFCPYLSGRRP